MRLKLKLKLHLCIADSVLGYGGAWRRRLGRSEEMCCYLPTLDCAFSRQFQAPSIDCWYCSRECASSELGKDARTDSSGAPAQCVGLAHRDYLRLGRGTTSQCEPDPPLNALQKCSSFLFMPRDVIILGGYLFYSFILSKSKRSAIVFPL